MESIEIQIDEHTLARARRLAVAQHTTLEKFITKIIQQMDVVEGKGDSVLGMFSQEPDIIDQVVASAMQTREEHVLRQPIE